MAGLLKQEYDLDVDIIEGGRGEFTVWVDSKEVARKIGDDFPTDETCVEAVRQALAT